MAIKYRKQVAEKLLADVELGSKNLCFVGDTLIKAKYADQNLWDDKQKDGYSYAIRCALKMVGNAINNQDAYADKLSTAISKLGSD